MFQPVSGMLQNPERYEKKAAELTPEKLQSALKAALLRIDAGIE